MQSHPFRHNRIRASLSIIALVALFPLATLTPTPTRAAENATDGAIDQAAVRELLHKVVSFYRSHVGYRGAYLWRYSGDLNRQEGENRATRTSGWTQPPGAPTVGEAFLEAYRVSGDQVCLAAAVETAEALVEAQLKSGGWSSHFDLAQPGRNEYSYRVDGDAAGRRNYTTFDDNKTQSALTFLMRVDEVLDHKHEPIQEAVQYALEHILAAQYPNGAWPQQFEEPPNPAAHPVLPASYPETWSREFTKEDYRDYYTLNDNNMSKIIDMLMEAHRIYGRQDCFDAAIKTGDFFLLAQMPEPQPGWAQQYDNQMHPAWARKFEPPAVTGGESQAVMRTLIKLFRTTGEKRFVESLPKAIAYYRKSMLPNNKLARFYELRTNRPLFFDREYNLTYDDSDMPTHYGFIVSSKLGSIERALEEARSAVAKGGPPEYRHPEPVQLTPRIKAAANEVATALDERGAWVEAGEIDDREEPSGVIDMRTFAENLVTLARYVGARPE